MNMEKKIIKPVIFLNEVTEQSEIAFQNQGSIHESLGGVQDQGSTHESLGGVQNQGFNSYTPANNYNYNQPVWPFYPTLGNPYSNPIPVQSNDFYHQCRVEGPASISVSESIIRDLYVSDTKKRNEANIDVCKTVAKNEADIVKQETLIRMREDAENCRDTKHPVIFESGSGKISYYFDNGRTTSRPTTLIEVDAFTATMYVSTSMHGNSYRVLSITWRKNNQYKSIFIPITENGVPNFHKILNAHGLKLQTSGRKQKELASALLNYCMNIEAKVELPYSFGWNLQSDGTWVFATENDLTMSQLLNNHIGNYFGGKGK